MKRHFYCLPYIGRRWELEAKLERAVDFVARESDEVQRYASLPRPDEDPLDHKALEEIEAKLEKIKPQLKPGLSKDQYDRLMDYAEREAERRAFLCPRSELLSEGESILALLEEWGIKEKEITRLRGLYLPILEKQGQDVLAARHALYGLMREQNSWEDYVDGCAETKEDWTCRLAAIFVIFASFSAATLSWSHFWNGLSVLSALLAGAAGRCVGILARPVGRGVLSSVVLIDYSSNMFGKLVIGSAGGLLGAVFLAVVPIGGATSAFGEAVNSCVNGGCSGTQTLVVIAVPMFFGLSTLTLRTIEQRIFGARRAGTKRRH